MEAGILAADMMCLRGEGDLPVPRPLSQLAFPKMHFILLFILLYKCTYMHAINK